MSEAGAIPSYKTHGVPRSIIHHIACNNFVVYSEYLDCFSAYYLKYWNATYTLSQITEGTILDAGTEYLVLYGVGTSRGRLKASPESQVALSFRKPAPEFNLPAYVIVKLKH